MPSTSRLAQAVRHGGLPRDTRAGLLRAEVARRARRRDAYPLPLGAATVYLSHDDYEIDWASLAFVVVDEAYAGDYAGAVVVDIGAHKGYYGAYGMLRGAVAVVSYEPETANFGLLARTATALGDAWHVRRRAVGAVPGEADLHVMGASWGHALHPPEEFDEHRVSVEQVVVDALADVLSDAVALADGRRVVVKVNIEGEECPTLLGTPAAAWAGVDELYVETHPWADCGADDLAAHLEAAGFARRPSAHHAVLRLRRSRTRDRSSPGRQPRRSSR
jgi:FkbM family methyltransferase